MRLAPMCPHVVIMFTYNVTSSTWNRCDTSVGPNSVLTWFVHFSVLCVAKFLILSFLAILEQSKEMGQGKIFLPISQLRA